MPISLADVNVGSVREFVIGVANVLAYNIGSHPESRTVRST